MNTFEKFCWRGSAAKSTDGEFELFQFFGVFLGGGGSWIHV